MSNSTACPSERLLNPGIEIAEWWTKTSLEPSYGVMKPKPFASLNHFTLPLAMCTLLYFVNGYRSSAKHPAARRDWVAGTSILGVRSHPTPPSLPRQSEKLGGSTLLLSCTSRDRVSTFA